VLAVFALGFAPLALGSCCAGPVGRVALARALSWCSVFGDGLLSLARGSVWIARCDFGPYTERTTPFYRILLNGQVLVIPHLPSADSPNANIANLKLLQHAEFEDYISNVQESLFSHKDAFSPEVYSNLCSQTYTEQLLEM